MASPFQVLQRSLVRFEAQPEGSGLFGRGAALLAARLERLNRATRALPHAQTGSGAAVDETSTDPRVRTIHLYE